MDTQLRYPTLLRHTIDAFDAKGFANITATYCVPLAPGRSRVFVRQPFRFRSTLPGFFMSAPLDFFFHFSEFFPFFGNIYFAWQ
jgi:Pheophorbide a oxygenase